MPIEIKNGPCWQCKTFGKLRKARDERWLCGDCLLKRVKDYTAKSLRAKMQGE